MFSIDGVTFAHQASQRFSRRARDLMDFAIVTAKELREA